MPAYLLLPLIFLLTPPVFAADGAIDGKKLFQTNCLGCHHASKDGATGNAPLLTNGDFLAITSDTFLFTTIKNGRLDAGMPPWEWLGEKKIRAIVAYLRSQSTKPDLSAAVNAEKKAKGDAARGAKLFASICQTCHGIQGRGYDKGYTGTHIGDPAFLRTASDGYIRHVVKHGRSGTAMQGFSGSNAIAALSDQEIDDIIVYLRTLSTKDQEKG